MKKKTKQEELNYIKLLKIICHIFYLSKNAIAIIGAIFAFGEAMIIGINGDMNLAMLELIIAGVLVWVYSIPEKGFF